MDETTDTTTSQQPRAMALQPVTITVAPYSSAAAQNIPQGVSSNLNADQVDGYNAALNPAPNQLIPLNNLGQFPTSVIPMSSGGGSGFVLVGAATDKNIIVANSGTWESVAMSGAITISDTGVTVYSGTVPTTVGGTNITSYTTGDTLYSSASNVLSKLGIGTSGQVLTVSGGIPSWATPSSSSPGGNVNDVQFNNPLGTLDGVDNFQFTFSTNVNSLLKVQSLNGGGPDTAQISVIAGTSGSGNPATATLLLKTDCNGGGAPTITMQGDPNTTNPDGGTLIFMATSAGGGILWVDRGITTNRWHLGTNSDTGGRQFYLQNYGIAGNPFPMWITNTNKGFGIYNTSPATDTFDVGIAAKFESTLQVSGDTTGSTTLVAATNSPAVSGTAPYTHLKFISSDGSTVWVAAYK